MFDTEFMVSPINSIVQLQGEVTMATLRKFKLSGLKYVDLTEDGPDAVPTEPHGEIEITRDGTDAFIWMNGGRTVVSRDPAIKELLYLLTGWDANPPRKLDPNYRHPQPPPHPGFRDDQIRAMVREELKAALSDEGSAQ